MSYPVAQTTFTNYLEIPEEREEIINPFIETFNEKIPKFNLPNFEFNHHAVQRFTPPPGPVVDFFNDLKLPKPQFGPNPIALDVKIEKEISEDSWMPKILSCIPIIGLIPTFTNEVSLKEKIDETQDLSEAKKLLAIKNHYNITSLIRVGLTIAIVTALALTILNPIIGVINITLIAAAIFYTFCYIKNKQALLDEEDLAALKLNVH